MFPLEFFCGGAIALSLGGVAAAAADAASDETTRNGEENDLSGGSSTDGCCDADDDDDDDADTDELSFKEDNNFVSLTWIGHDDRVDVGR